VFFIKFVLLLRGFAESDEVGIFSFLALPHLKNDSVQALSTQTIARYCSGQSERWSR
jgi:hypothetical protein